MAAAPQDAVVVCDVPLLVDKHVQDRYDLVVVVDASEETRSAGWARTVEELWKQLAKEVREP